MTRELDPRQLTKREMRALGVKAITEGWPSVYKNKLSGCFMEIYRVVNSLNVDERVLDYLMEMHPIDVKLHRVDKVGYLFLYDECEAEEGRYFVPDEAAPLVWPWMREEGAV